MNVIFLGRSVCQTSRSFSRLSGLLGDREDRFRVQYADTNNSYLAILGESHAYSTEYSGAICIFHA